MDQSGDVPYLFCCCVSPGVTFMGWLILSSWFPNRNRIGSLYKYHLSPEDRQALEAKEVFQAEIDDDM